MAAATTSSSKPTLPSFEFTKRKRWTETLFSEISEALLLIVSPACKVLYCGPAIVELLGWKEDQLVDADLVLFIEDEDQDNFRWSFTESLRTGQDLFTYARFKCDQPPSNDPSAKPGLLFEVKGHPHFAQDQQQPQCFFLSAMPYPGRDIALLNTFLDLKIENEKLSQRIYDLKFSMESSPRTSELALSSQFATAQYPQRLNQASAPLVLNHSSLYSRSGQGLPFYPLSEATGYGLHRAQKVSLPKLDDTTSPVSRNDGLGQPADNDSEEAQRKKKLKKTLVSDEQRVCVTCGRTDSPEWRKGPHGPKTLCNACGLRWAKRTRKTETDANTPRPCLKDQDRGGPGVGDASLGQAGGQQLMF